MHETGPRIGVAGGVDIWRRFECRADLKHPASFFFGLLLKYTGRFCLRVMNTTSARTTFQIQTYSNQMRSHDRFQTYPSRPLQEPDPKAGTLIPPLPKKALVGFSIAKYAALHPTLALNA